MKLKHAKQFESRVINYINTMYSYNKLPDIIHMTDQNLNSLAYIAWNKAYTSVKFKYWKGAYIQGLYKYGITFPLTGLDKVFKIKLYQPDADIKRLPLNKGDVFIDVTGELISFTRLDKGYYYGIHCTGEYSKGYCAEMEFAFLESEIKL